MNEKGVFSKITVNDLGAGVGNATFNEAAILALPIPEEYSGAIPEGASEDIEANDSLLVAFAKIWKKASQTLSLTPASYEYKQNSYNVDKDTDDQKTLLIQSGSVNLPGNAPNGFTITVKRKSVSDVAIIAGEQNYIDSNLNKIVLKNKYASVRLIKGASKWHIIHRRGVIE